MEKADAVIIGAGIIGLSAGYWLAKNGAKVIVLDKGRVAWEASGRATGFLSLRGEQPLEAPLAAAANKLWMNWTRSSAIRPNGCPVAGSGWRWRRTAGAS